MGNLFRFTLSVYALFWHGWGLLFFLGLASAFCAAAYNFLIKKDLPHAKQNLISSGFIVGTALLMVSVFFSFQDFFILLKEGFGELSKFTHRGLDLCLIYSWLSVRSKTLPSGTSPSLPGALSSCSWLSGAGPIGLRMSLKNSRQGRAIDTLILSIFLVVTMVLSLHGERFVLFATIPLSILAAAAANRFISLKSVGLPLAAY